MIPAIQVENLHRHFGTLKAVDGVFFEIPQGSVCGFIGAHGAGRTTAMRVLATSGGVRRLPCAGAWVPG